jgi:DUF4097 and DUF4098 domain-containing protein YvlB
MRWHRRRIGTRRDVTSADATNLANGVAISTASGTISAQEVTVNYPQSLEVDYEVLTPSTTAVSLSTALGNVSADNYTSMLSAMTQTGDISLQAVDGNLQATATTGNITIGLTGTAWTGAGLTANTGAGIPRPTSAGTRSQTLIHWVFVP